MLTSTVAMLHDNSIHGEDNYLVRAMGDSALLDAVMDGVSRRRGGQATRLVVEALEAAPLTSADDVAAVLTEVNSRLYQLGGGHFLLTTVSATLCLDDKIYGVGIGDSPVYLIRSGSFRQLFSGVRGVFLGARKQLVDLHRVEVTVEPGDRLVLATDGVTDNLASRELVEVVRRATSPDNAADQIATMLASRQAQGLLPEPFGAGFRCDDRTAILRFFLM